jgi:hypothetical protein
MMFAAEFGSGQVLWSLVWFALFVMWLWLVIMIFGDIMRSDSLSGLGKAVWALGIIVLPYLGIFLYLIVNGGAMNRQAIDDSRRTAIDDRRVGSSATDEVARLARLHDDGEITDAEFGYAKAQLFA